MINVSVYKTESGIIQGFRCSGHAGFAESGSDIICAAVSVLVINTVNAIAEFTPDTYSYQEDEKNGIIDFRVDKPGKEAELLLNTLVLGLTTIRKEYGKKYIDLQNS